MKQISLFLLPLLVLAALVPIAPFGTSASAGSGAAFTTVNVAMDGRGHCANGNPRINCNIYNGKEFVWLNGGPSAAKLLPDGPYFFAVLAPGGQPAANDGTPKNLSDDFSAYTDRTFTVKNGKVSTYAGSHSFDVPLIRLFPYADTPNPGGVYALAICSLAKGYPVKASACKYDQFKVVSQATNTPTSTPTGSPTNTPTNTPTSTATTTATATSTPTNTPTITPTSTPTNTPTPTVTVPVCGPWQTETANFDNPYGKKLNVGESVLGVDTLGRGKVAPHLNIQDAHQHLVKLLPSPNSGTAVAYGAGSNNSVPNGGMSKAGGFGDIYNKPTSADDYTFTFIGNIKVKDFTLRMLDFGDFNPTSSGVHDAVMKAFYSGGSTEMTLHYNSPAVVNPTSSFSPNYGNLQWTGDAIEFLNHPMPKNPMLPGNWTWYVNVGEIAITNPITSVELRFNEGYDPKVGFDGLTFTYCVPP